MKKRQSPFEIIAVRSRQIFAKNKIDPVVKLLAASFYHLGLSYRSVSLAMELLYTLSLESVRLWYRKTGATLPVPDRICRSIIEVDETKLSISGRFAFIWYTIDVKRYGYLL